MMGQCAPKSKTIDGVAEQRAHHHGDHAGHLGSSGDGEPEQEPLQEARLVCPLPQGHLRGDAGRVDVDGGGGGDDGGDAEAAGQAGGGAGPRAAGGAPVPARRQQLPSQRRRRRRRRRADGGPA